MFLQDDTVELLENSILTNRQYLMRFTGWNNEYDFRASREELLNLVELILNFLQGEPDDQSQCD